MGLEFSDDAGVYRLRDDLAIVQTVDFITPIVDDPYTFGQIAATNAISDIYAMGATPVTAMNVVAFPAGKLELEVLREVLRGGVQKIHEADATLVGGHTVTDEEFKYGLSVTGVVHPEKIVRNGGAQVGDLLILTKAVGTGIVNTGVKRGAATDEMVHDAIASMCELNRCAAEVMREFPVHACTDITGFGLLGHAKEMALASKAGLIIYADRVPLLTGALELAQQNMIPGGSFRNRDYLARYVEVSARIPEAQAMLLFDAQTSGGLLIALAATMAAELLTALQARGIKSAAIIGEVTGAPAKVRVR